MSIYTMKEMPVSERPYEKLELFGEKRLTNAELIAIILKTGTKDLSAIEVAQKVLKECMGEKEDLSLAGISLDKLKSIKGVGRVKAITLKAAFELANRVNMTTENRLFINSVPALSKFVADRISNEKQENILVVGLDTKSRLVKSEIVSVGKLNRADIENREIFRTALECGCAYIAIGHNHPSGDPTPSNEDIIFTRNLIKLGRLLSIPLVDHIVLGNGNFVSLRRDNIINDWERI